MGRHRRRRSWFWAWFPVTLAVLWLAILAGVASESPQPVFQRAVSNFLPPEHIIHQRVFQPPRTATSAMAKTVTRGETLWSIAAKYCGNGSEYKRIMAVNGIKTWRIYPGEKIHVTCR